MPLIGFLEPQFLWGLLFAGVVLVLHLLQRPRTVRLPFSTLRFFDESAVTKTRSRSIKKLLLLCTRILMTAMIIVIFTGPFLKNDPLRSMHDPASDLFIWVDPTPSMQYQENGISLYKKAIHTIDSIVQLRTDRNRIHLFDPGINDFKSFTSDSSQTTAAQCIEVPQLEQAFTRAIETTRHPVFIILSDFQSPTTRIMETFFSQNRVATVTVVYLSLVPNNPWNCTLEEVRVITGNDPLALTHLTSSGNHRCPATLSVSIDNIHSPPQGYTLSPGTDTIITVPIPRVSRAGWGKVVMQCNDPLSFDNTARFIMDVHDTVTVRIIGNKIESYPLVAALGAACTGSSLTIATSTPESFSIEQCHEADIIIVNGGTGAQQAMRIISQTHPLKKQAIITAYDSVLTKDAASVWKKGVSPLSARLADTASGLWKGFPSLHCDELKVYAYRTGLHGIPLLSLDNETPLCTSIPDTVGRRIHIALATPLGITSSNNFCETAFYVPFIDRLLRTVRNELSQQQTPWIVGKMIKNQWYGHHRPVSVLDPGGKQILLLQQQPSFSIGTPGIYKVVPPDEAPFFKNVVIDPVERELDYRVPTIAKINERSSILISPEELLAYCTIHRRSITWIIPWLLLVLFCFMELLLRDDGERIKGRHR